MQFSIYMLPNSGARLTQCRKLTIVQTEPAIKHIIYHKDNLIVVNIYKHTLTFWHHPGIEPGTFQSQVRHSNHYSTAPLIESRLKVNNNSTMPIALKSMLN